MMAYLDRNMKLVNNNTVVLDWTWDYFLYKHY